jgi:hypothetical protein
MGNEQKKSLTNIYNTMKNMQYMASEIGGEFEVIGHEVVDDIKEPDIEQTETEPTEELNKLTPAEDIPAENTPATQEPPVEQPVEDQSVTSPVANQAPISTAPAKPTYTKLRPPKQGQPVKWQREDGYVTELIVDKVDRRMGTFTAHTKGGGSKGPLEISKILPDNTRVTANTSVFNLKKFASK